MVGWFGLTCKSQSCLFSCKAFVIYKVGSSQSDVYGIFKCIIFVKTEKRDKFFKGSSFLGNFRFSDKTLGV